MPAVDLEMRSINDDEVTAYLVAVDLGFGEDTHPDDEAVFRSMMPLDRTVAVFDGTELVGTLGDWALTVGVPGGGSLPMAGTTVVGVRSTHRRRGILRAMVERHLAMVVDRGEPLAGLWASESAIYGRFGFGLANEAHEITIDTRLTSVPPGPEDVTVELAHSRDVPAQVAPFWTSLTARRAGWIDRGEPRWKAIAADPEHRRQGASAMRHVIARRGGEVVGHVAYRQKTKWEHDLPGGSIVISTLAALDADANRALWHYVTNIDLFPHVSLWNAPLDDTVAMEASNLRQVGRRVLDALYVRVLDVVTCLEGRRYQTDGEIAIEVRDDLGHAAGAFRLTVSDGVGRVSTIDGGAAVVLDVRELGALYLGRDCSAALGRLGRIGGDADAVAQLGRIFRTATAPYCPEMF